MKKLLIVLIILVAFNSVILSQKSFNDYLHQSIPEFKAITLKIGVYFENEDNRKRSFNFAFSPDGTELFFSYVVSRSETEGTLYEIRTSKFVNGEWTLPKTADFSGEYWDVDINFSPDGKYLFFASERPVKDSVQQGIFYLEKTIDGWSEPKFTGKEVSSTYGEVWPSMSEKRNLFFRSARPGGYGADDLYRADWIDGEFTNVRNLGPNVNTKFGESNATIAPDESYILLCSKRPEANNIQQIYVSFQIGDNIWTKAEPLGAEINSTRAGGPTFSADGKYLFFGKPDGHYWISTDFIKKMKPYARYLYQIPPDSVPKIFAPGVISTPYHEHSFPAISPNEELILWNTSFFDNTYEFPFRIIAIQKKNNKWSDPDYFHSTFFKETSCACFSPNGDKIFFCGDTAKIKENRNADIWFSDRNKNGWSEPKPIPGKVNTMKRESQVSVTKDGTIYFLGYLEGVKNNYGIFRSRLVDGEYQEPEALPEIINSLQLDWTPFIALDESYLLFSSYRDGGYGRGDLWISFRDNNDNWSAPLNLGPSINDEYNERFPYVSPDGKYLFFLSDKVNPELLSKSELSYSESQKYYSLSGNGQCDIYWVDAKIIEELKLKKLEK